MAMEECIHSTFFGVDAVNWQADPRPAEHWNLQDVALARGLLQEAEADPNTSALRCSERERSFLHSIVAGRERALSAMPDVDIAVPEDSEPAEAAPAADIAVGAPGDAAAASVA